MSACQKYKFEDTSAYDSLWEILIFACKLGDFKKFCESDKCSENKGVQNLCTLNVIFENYFI